METQEKSGSTSGATTTTILNSENEFDSFIAQRKGVVVVVHFWADWSEACGQMVEVVEELQKEVDSSALVFVQVDAEGVPELSLRYKVVAVPTFIFLREGSSFDRIDGLFPGDLTKKVRQYQSGYVPAARSKRTKAAPAQSNGSAQSPSGSKEELNKRLKGLLDSYPCMVFMKGDPDSPKCGFSAQLMDILKTLNADFRSFDILTDEKVRQGLKEFSSWPTYPQVYIKGELIGGLDIINEMMEAGEFEFMVPKKLDLNQKLKTLISRHPVMIFMKGIPSEPRCKFSKTLMEILNEMPNVKYDTFNILEDNAVREGLKTYSNWPTYPQVYVKGELLGGIDIIKELKEGGELEQSLTG